VQDNQTLLATIVEAALEEIPRLMRSVEEAVAHRNSVDVRRLAHTLHGSLHYFGAASAVEQAQRLEQMAHQGDLGNADEALRMLDARTQEVVRCLSEYLQEAYGMPQGDAPCNSGQARAASA
jgi:HPt (histidine-containing phosphotransfer) domain-containing protein